MAAEPVQRTASRGFGSSTTRTRSPVISHATARLPLIPATSGVPVADLLHDVGNRPLDELVGTDDREPGPTIVVELARVVDTAADADVLAVLQIHQSLFGRPAER